MRATMLIMTSGGPHLRAWSEHGRRPTLMTIGQTAVHAHVARHIVRRWIDEGLVPVYRSPALGRRRLELARVDALIAPFRAADDEADERLSDLATADPSRAGHHRAVVSSQQRTQNRRADAGR